MDGIHRTGGGFVSSYSEGQPYALHLPGQETPRA
jgi:hypothetical protein